MANISLNQIQDPFVQSINLRLAMIGCPTVDIGGGDRTADMVDPLFARFRETIRKGPAQNCPADERLQIWLTKYLKGENEIPRIPAKSFILDQPGFARALSLPVRGDAFCSDLLKSYRLAQGVLHNPANDRRTTEGVFHIAEGGLPIPDDKRAVPKATFA